MLQSSQPTTYAVAQPSQAAPAQPPVQKPEVVLPTTQPISLKIAEEFYLNHDYEKAYAAYETLNNGLRENEEAMSDFFKLKMGFCAKLSDDTDYANQLFKVVLQSNSPILRVIANYNLSFDNISKELYLKARTRAYKVITLIGAVGFDMNWAFNVRRNCEFLVAESLTKELLPLLDGDKDIPGKLWSRNTVDSDPLINLTEGRLRYLLNYGKEQLSKGRLSPQIEKINSGSPERWSIICNGASIEELLARFAANGKLDVYWAFGKNTEPEMKHNYKKRPVVLYMPNATTQQFAEAAAGAVGLLAKTSDNKTITIFDTETYSSLSDHKSLLMQQAISLWQRFQLTYHNDDRVPNAHFALALLQAKKGLLTNAIAEYKLIATQFSKTSLATFALLHSSKLKISIKDYMGAKQDLKNLVELYPDSEITSIGGLYLADATMKSKLYKESARLYRKIYNLGLSPKLQTLAALGAGKSFYEGKDYESAEKWFIRYINKETDRTAKDLYSAYILLGKTYLALGKHKDACDALQYALEGRLTKKDYVETVFALVEGNIKLENFIKALDILENIHSWQLSQKDSVEMLLLKSKTFRTMGLVDNAVTVIGDRADYLSDNQLKAKITLELVNCYIDNGELKLARNELLKTLVITEPGPLAHDIAFALADIYLKLEQNPRAISVCLQLLDLNPSEQMKQKTLNLLATAYKGQKNYEKATNALMGYWSKSNSAVENKTFEGM